MANILLVEDHEDVREALSEVLTQAGHKVDTANDGLDALGVLNKKKYDLLVTDIMMPNKTGFDLIDDVKKANSDMKIIAISGGGKYLPSDMTTMLANMRADAALAKPFMPDKIIETVNDVMAS